MVCKQSQISSATGPLHGPFCGDLLFLQVIVEYMRQKFLKNKEAEIYFPPAS